MGYMTIDGRKVEFTDEPNVLSVIRNADIDIPTLCYHSELSVYGACRLCTVEDERGKTFASCSEPPRDGMVIYTNTPRLMKYRKMILELLLAAHCRDCTTCIKSGECQLQALAHRMGVTTVRFENTKEQYPLDFSSPSIVRDPNKCILCGDCVRMCDNVQSVNAIDFAYRGTKALVTPAFNKKIAETDCVNCGQCRVVCPTGAISINTNIEVIWDSEVTRILGEDQVESVHLKNTENGEKRNLPVEGLFVAVGVVPCTTLIKGQVALDDFGYVKAREDCVTNIPGVFAAGDLRTKPMKQIVTAVADGANAINSARNYLTKKE